MSPFNTTLLQEKNALSSLKPWVLAAHIQGSSTLVAALDGYDKIIADTEVFSWKDSADGDVDFEIFPFLIPNINLEATGKFPTLTLRAFNTAEVAKIVENNAELLIGTTIVLYFINTNSIKDSSGTFIYNMETYPLKFEFVITNISIGQYIGFELGGPNYLLRLLPSKRYYRDYCDAQFQGDYCWMKDFATSDTCDKQWETCVGFWETYGKDAGVRGIKFQAFPMLTKGSLEYY